MLMRMWATAPALVVASLLFAAAAPADRAPEIVARPIALDPTDPARTRVGALRYLGGWVLTSRDRRFGGISSLYAVHGRFVALSDNGLLFRFRMERGGRIGEVAFQPLPGVPGAGGGKDGRDSESLQHDPASGRFWVGFERYDQIWRYDPRFARAEAHAAPPAMAGWPSNGGPEAMARLADGRFLVFAEEQAGPDAATREALLFAGDPSEAGTAATRFFYRPPTGFVPTDAAELPDGRILVLNRHYSVSDGMSAALAMIDPREIARDRVLVSREIARLAAPLTVDNTEALSVEQDRGRTILWLASDDNFKPFQQTLLMKFALE